MNKMTKLIKAIAKSDNENVQNAFLEWQDERIKTKERLIEKLDKLLKESKGKHESNSNSLHKHAVMVLLPLFDEMIKYENEQLGKNLLTVYDREIHANNKYCLAIVRSLIESRFDNRPF